MILKDYLHNQTLRMATAKCVCLVFLGMFMKLQKATTYQLRHLSVCPSVHLSTCNTLALTGWISMKFDISSFMKCVKNIQF